jgi:hypothetical protein
VTKNQVEYTTNKMGRNLFDITYDVSKETHLSKWEQWILLTSDRHWDNPSSNWEMQIKHMKQAQERNAGIIDCGDLFCAMQGKYDPRSNKSSVREQHQVGDYLDSIITTAADFFEPYADRMIFVAMGNHEESIRNRHETNLIERFCDILKYRTGHKIHNGGYSGFFRIRLRQEGRTISRIITTHYSHGHGGGGPVTKGVIQTNRKAVYLPDADMVISGHVHERWQLELMRLRVGRSAIYHDSQLHVLLPTYKEEFKDGFSGWHAQRGAPPKPIGAAWMRLYYDGQRDLYKRGLRFEILRAD